MDFGRSTMTDGGLINLTCLPDVPLGYFLDRANKFFRSLGSVGSQGDQLTHVHYTKQ